MRGEFEMEPVTFDRKILSVAMTQEIDRKNFQTTCITRSNCYSRYFLRREEI